jgi:hypothetical protein
MVQHFRIYSSFNFLVDVSCSEGLDVRIIKQMASMNANSSLGLQSLSVLQ